MNNSPLPSPRLYHAYSICKFGISSNMIIIHGGINNRGSILNDCWGLREHKNGTWEWVLAPYNQGYQPQKRFQHTITFFYNFLIVIGGRNYSVDYYMNPIEIYDTQNAEWVYVFAFFNRFQHSAWIVGKSIYIHGGFTLKSTLIAQSGIIKINLLKMFKSDYILNVKFDELKKKIADEKKRKKQFKKNK